MAQDYEQLLKICADELELIECKLTNPDGTYYDESKCILKHIKYMCRYLVSLQNNEHVIVDIQSNEPKHDINILLEAISRYLIAAQSKRFINRFEFYLKNSSRIGIWNYSLRLTAFAYTDMLHLGYLMEKMFQIYIDKYYNNGNTDPLDQKFKYMWNKVKIVLQDEDSKEEFENTINNAVESGDEYNPVLNLDDILMNHMCSSLGIHCSKGIVIGPRAEEL